MASIFRFVTPAFRTRSPLRDAATDARRMDAVRLSVSDALGNAIRERAGLKERLGGYQMRAASLADDAPGYGERSAREERELAQAEQQVIAAIARLEQLTAHIAHLEDVLAAVEIDGPAREARLGA